MSKIKVLPPQITNLIAAGEVVERPASIVKELVENSLDAGASRIRVNVQQGGRKLVQVADDGCGMDREDAMLCLEPHATSKIQTEADVERIQTMGFRGEALPSIAAVTKFTIQTCQAEAPEGSEVIVEGGKIIDVRSAGCAPGTIITAKNLFFNLPVRRKFLRTPQTESLHIQEAIQLQALAHPEVSFELIMDSRTALKVAAPSDLQTRAAMVLGKEMVREMIPFDFTESGIRVYGLVARPGFTRSTRKDQVFFVNKRPVQSDTLYYAARDAYHGLVMKGRFAPMLVFLEMNTGNVDVNVHPQKREIRFRNNSLVGQVVVDAMQKTLQQNRSVSGATVRTDVGLGHGIRPGFSKLSPVDLQTGSAVKPFPEPVKPAHPVDSKQAVGRAKSVEVNRQGQKMVSTPAVRSDDQAKANGVSKTVELPATVDQTGTEQVEQGATPDDLIQATGGPLKPAMTNQPPVDDIEKSAHLSQAKESEKVSAPVPGGAPLVTGAASDEADAVMAAMLADSGAVATAGRSQEALFDLQEHKRPSLRQQLFGNFKVIGIYANLYILAEGPEGLVIIDQRAAHQRIVFERIMQKVKNQEGAGQPLLIPVTVDLSNSDRLVLERHLDYFRKIGFGIEPFGGSTYMINAVPVQFPHENLLTLIHEMLDDLSQSASAQSKVDEVRMAQLACRYAMGNKQALNDDEVERLLEDLAGTEMPYTCPNGRPVMVNMARSEIDRRFGKRS